MCYWLTSVCCTNFVGVTLNNKCWFSSLKKKKKLMQTFCKRPSWAAAAAAAGRGCSFPPARSSSSYVAAEVSVLQAAVGSPGHIPTQWDSRQEKAVSSIQTRFNHVLCPLNCLQGEVRWDQTLLIPHRRS